MEQTYKNGTRESGYREPGNNILWTRPRTCSEERGCATFEFQLWLSFTLLAPWYDGPLSNVLSSSLSVLLESQLPFFAQGPRGGTCLRKEGWDVYFSPFLQLETASSGTETELGLTSPLSVILAAVSRFCRPVHGPKCKLRETKNSSGKERTEAERMGE